MSARAERLARPLRDPLGGRGGPWDLTAEQVHFLAAAAEIDSAAAPLLPDMPVDPLDEALKRLAADAALRGLAARALVRAGPDPLEVAPALADAVRALCAARALVRVDVITADDRRSWSMFGDQRTYRLERLSPTDVLLEEVGTGPIQGHLRWVVPEMTESQRRESPDETIIAGVLAGRDAQTQLGNTEIREASALSWADPVWEGTTLTWAATGGGLSEITGTDDCGLRFDTVEPEELRQRIQRAIEPSTD